ncbi:MAG: hypothetical protein WAW61_21615 [Methylococcaceae bacterium]
MDQTDLGNRITALMISVRMGDRLLLGVDSAANIGVGMQKILLDCVLAWIPQ